MGDGAHPYAARPVAASHVWLAAALATQHQEPTT